MRPNAGELLMGNNAILGDVARESIESAFDRSSLDALRLLGYYAAQEAVIGLRITLQENTAIADLLVSVADGCRDGLRQRINATCAETAPNPLAAEKRNDLLRGLLDEVHIELEHNNDTARCALIRKLYTKIARMRCCYVAFPT